MIHEIAVELRELLRTAGVPMPVVDGPERTESVVTPRERIVVERVRTPEQILPPKGANTRNPVHVFDRRLNAKITIYARDPAAGAHPHEHLRRADDVCDSVLAALRQVLVARKNGAEIGAPQLKDLEDTKGAQVANFEVYEIHFFVRRAVEKRTWPGAAAEEGGAFTASTIASTTVVGLQGDPTPATETGCGA